MSWGGATFRKWFEAQERILREQAKAAGLLEHSTSIGAAREFVVKNVLRAVLPPSIHIGSGIVTDAYDHRSKQIDVVIYDPRFPLMEVHPGVGLYPFEGVIATVEVKSTLTSRELEASLDNGGSLLELCPCGPPPEAVWRRASVLDAEFHSNPLESRIHAGCEWTPATYVFAFNGIGAETIRDCVASWFDGKGRPILRIGTGLCPMIPRIIISECAVCAANDGWMKAIPSDENLREMQADGPTARIFFASWKTEWPFWWFASHLLHTVCTRLGMTHSGSGFQYSFDPYLGYPEPIVPEYLYSASTKGL